MSQHRNCLALRGATETIGLGVSNIDKHLCTRDMLAMNEVATPYTYYL